MVGTAGRYLERFVEVTPIRRTRLSLVKASAPMLAAMTACARPEITSLIASPVALSGMCTTSMPARPLK